MQLPAPVAKAFQTHLPLLTLGLPLALLAGVWAGGVPTMFVVACLYPLLLLRLSVHRVPPPDRIAVDPLTGLPLRDQLLGRIEGFLRRPDVGETGILLLEIDGFKALEESHPRPVIEAVLAETARRLRETLRGEDMVARLDGPAFGIALAPTYSLRLGSLLRLSARLQANLAREMEVDGGRFRMTASIGFARSDMPGTTDAETMVQSATTAMIEALRNGPGAVRSYSEAMQRRIQSRKNLSDDIPAAFDRGEIFAHFQPQIATETGAVTGFETLARWRHPERGMIPPADFLPALRHAGMMADLGQRMMRDALVALRQWRAMGHDVARVGVNLSAEELRDSTLVDRIAGLLAETGTAPGDLVIEVLETVAALPDDPIIDTLARLAKLGCGLDLDDFGTGHASITNIRRFSIGRLKIDRSFVRGLDADPEQRGMVEAILTMARRLGLDTVAEGVETMGELATLRAIGAGHAQGFLIGRPMSARDTADWLTARAAPDLQPVPLHRRAL